MISLLTMLFTAGGSAGFGAVLKGIFGSIADSRENSYKLALAEKLRDNENAIEFQKALLGNSEESSLFVRGTRRILALMCVTTLCSTALLCTIYPSVPIVTFSNLEGTGTTEILWGIINFPAKQTPMVVTTGHIALFQAVVVFPMILGFYFTPGGKR